MEILIAKPTTNVNTKPMKLAEFENYFWSSEEDCELELRTQYRKLPQTSTNLCTVALTPQNTGKNRYKNIVPYDKTRVVLRRNEDSDYINANYIDGYENSKAFIATQAPLPSTTNDFWWMVWQEEVLTIVMLTELVENGCIKSEKYWPDHLSHARFGDILIKNTSRKIFSDYTVQQLQLHRDGETRVIQHYQYTTWPDHDVPTYPQNFTPFVKSILALPQQKSTILVHCNAGCGRTGTLILCDVVLRMAAKEKQVDFLKVLTAMREQRPHMVTKAEQYVFAHSVVFDCLFGKDFSIPINNHFRDNVQQVLRKTTVKPLMEHLDKVMARYNTKNRINLAMTDEDKEKIGFSSTSQGESQVYLFPSAENPLNSTSAVNVDCYRCPRKFIVAQQPLSNTTEDFWRLVKEFEVNTIVSLNEMGEDDSTSMKNYFWSKGQEMSYTTLETLEEVNAKTHTLMKLKVTDKTKPDNEKTVNIVNMKKWKPQTAKPTQVKDLIVVWKTVLEKSWKGNSQIVVTCQDGVTASGLFVALAYLLEKINSEQICDVFSAVRTVRQSRNNFVEDWAQFEFLYKAALVYIEEFDNYDNFN